MRLVGTSTAAPRRIALCVDDIGLHDGIDSAALRLVAGGRATAVSALTQSANWPRMAAALHEFPADAVDVGLHFNLTETLAGEPAIAALPLLVARACMRWLPRERIRSALQRQLDAFEACLRRPPAHLDGHQHVHQLPLVRDIVLQTLHERYAGAPPWLRSCTMRPLPATDAPARRAQRKARIIEALGARSLRDGARALNFATNRALLGVYDFSGGAAGYRKLLRLWLAQAEDGDLLMCHAGHRSEAADALRSARESEMAVIDSADFDRLLATQRIALEPMSRILR